MGRPAINLIGQKFNRLTVLERDLSYPSGAGKSVYWKCKCDCGNIKSVRTDKLRNGEIQSCGCLSKEIRTQLFLDDLTDQRFGRLLVLKRDMDKPRGKSCFAYWICKCDCGNVVSVRGNHLRDNTTSSCGCLNSAGEEKISRILQDHNIDYKTQYEFDDLKGDYNHLRFDFAIFKQHQLWCLVEYQGQQHTKPWGNEPTWRFQKRQEYDKKKKDYCAKHQITFIEISYVDFDKIDWEYLSKKLSL